MSNYYLGRTPVETLGGSPRYLYLLRRNEDGELFVVRSDQLTDDTSYTINNPGRPEDNFEDFEAGVDFFEGVNDEHQLVYPNMNYTQYRWDDRSMFYYVNDEGQLVQKLFGGYEYPTGISGS
jgi:hypothetical protein